MLWGFGETVRSNLILSHQLTRHTQHFHYEVSGKIQTTEKKEEKLEEECKYLLSLLAAPFAITAYDF